MISGERVILIWQELNRRNVVRVAIAYAVVAWLLLQVADVILNNIEAPAWIFQVILLLLLIGFPVALILAWAFELTPEGLKKEEDVDRDQSITHATGRKLDFVIIGVLTIAVAYFVTDKFYWADEMVNEPNVETSVAVLPFVPLSSGEDDGYFADGLTEEILNALAQLPELQVTARTSSFFFKGQNIPVPEIAERLSVVHIVEGSVRRDGDRLRITAQLIRASDDFHLWSQTYDRTLVDVFAVQEDIAENIAAALNVVLDDSARQVMRNAGINDVEAFIAYQKGMEAFARAHGYSRSDDRRADLMTAATSYFDQSLEAAPGLAMARIMKTDRAEHIIFDIAAGLREEQYTGEAQEMLASLMQEYDLAVELSPPGNQRDFLDLERTLFSDDWSALPGKIRKALQPGGGCSQYNWTHTFIAPFASNEQLIDKTLEMLACDPMSLIPNIGWPEQLLWAGDTEGALRAIEEVQENGPDHRWVENLHYWVMLAAGRADGPVPEGGNRLLLREALVGDPVVARKMAEDYWSNADVDDQSSLEVASVVGDRERANEFAARIDVHPGGDAVLSNVVLTCFCGAPFDLEATPNYKARIEEAGFKWPPPKPIDYPTKTW